MSSNLDFICQKYMFANLNLKQMIFILTKFLAVVQELVFKSVHPQFKKEFNRRAYFLKEI